MSFRTVIFVAFAGVIVVLGGLVAGLSFRTGEEAVDGLSSRLAHALSTVIHERLAHYTHGPVQLLTTHADAMRRGVLSADDADRMALVFWNALEPYDNVGYLSYGGLDGTFVGAERTEDGTLRYHIRDESTGAARHTFRGLPDGQRAHRIRTQAGYDPRQRPWYTAAVRAMRTRWTPIYASKSAPGAAYMTAVTPVVGPDGAFRGVMGADVVVSQINAYLRSITDDLSGVVVIVDRDGRLVATSVDEPVMRVVEDDVVRQRAVDARNPTVSGAARHVMATWGGFGELRGAARTRLEADDHRYFVALTPLADDQGLDWVIVTLVPEEEFLAPFERSARDTLLVCLVALVVALLLALAISRRIAAPILGLAAKARRIHEGDLDVEFTTEADDEIGTLTATMGEMVQGLRDRDFIRDAFGRYVTPELVDRFIAEPASLRLGGQLCTATLLMSDLRGFTSLSERMPPDAMVALLNRYLGVMTDVILRYHGTIIEFIGDAIFVAFGAPFEGDNDAVDAVRCAIDMQVALAEFNQVSAAAGVPTLGMGIGLNSGEVVAGNLGSERAAKYGVVGAAVNLTARIESLTVGTQILMSQATFERVDGHFDLVGPQEVRVKGVTEPLAVYEVRGVRGRPDLTVPVAPTTALVPVDLPVHLFFLEGELLGSQPIEGRITALGPAALTITSSRELRPLAKLMLRVGLGDGRWTSDIYGSVVESRPGEDGPPHTGDLALTVILPEDREKLASLWSKEANP